MLIMQAFRFRTPHWLIAAALLFALTGCSEPPPEFGEVTGIVTLKGKPTKDIQVRFLPVPTSGKEIPIAAVGVTDASGRYTLKHVYNGQEGLGAVIGQHRVVVEEVNLPYAAQGEPPPKRKIPPIYSSPGQTPLSAEVTAGSQELNFDIR